MAITKTEVISVRLLPDTKTVLASAAAAERRSMAARIEVMALEFCRAHSRAPSPDAQVGNDRTGWR